ncbi:16892_t:CDS:2 [Dentiscutata erythropus]|uniref:16892_t:CDS:1 n=1 Tax=Dentiscutata erythropus TaxID=1348616 RepID=A0A9N9DML4_9GLOM|nr:16892_t:CDS:2 [Dentiscutata erythropus]
MQAVFVKDGFFSVGEIPKEIKDDAIVQVLVTDYAGQEHNFIIKVIFPYYNSCFVHLKDNVQPHKLLIFVMRQMEIINNEFYVYANSINHIDTQFLYKKNVVPNNVDSQVFSSPRNTICSKLIATHQNVSENLKERSEHKIGISSDHTEKSILSDSLNDIRSLRCMRVEDCDNSAKEFSGSGFDNEMSTVFGDNVCGNESNLSGSSSSKCTWTEDFKESVSGSCTKKSDNLVDSDQGEEYLDSIVNSKCKKESNRKGKSLFTS